MVVALTRGSAATSSWKRRTPCTSGPDERLPSAPMLITLERQPKTNCGRHSKRRIQNLMSTGQRKGKADRELEAIGSILTALDGLDGESIQRVFDYVLGRMSLNC